jgi:hypothetical protein
VTAARPVRLAGRVTLRGRGAAVTAKVERLVNLTVALLEARGR